MGEVFAGRYELIDPIASGGMGTVWRVLDRMDGQVKAAKMLNQSDAAMLLRFVREQSLRIDHTHIVTPQSWAGVDDRVLFTMPLVAGGSVSTLMRKYGALPPRWIGRLVDQTLQALEAVHAAGIVHRDVKPGNLLLEPTGRGVPHLRLTDFGIAVPTDEARLTHVAMVIGTPGYMPPEQQLGADPDPSADIYALGMVVLEMLTATRPPREAAPFDPAPLRNGDPARDAVVDLIAAATAYDPEARPSATELRALPALRRLLDLPADPADPITVTDVFPPLPVAAGGGTVARATAAYPPPPPTGPSSAPTIPPPPAPPRRTQEETLHQLVPSPARPGVLAPVLLLVIGLLGLVVSGWLLLG
ncbi:serine/threonine protein kinase [Nocardioides immobilis]|uniref:non-specific serine/threonine protein kinase n=1 Tax=Nocardioides immobilis TaxID=2049295 RepID=A0A417Y1G7_9ACTN|nr:serine/threonine-protein kinase [Nocardioides immobilis]RHW26508.1 serine/threonine protein kinase [Nocardioides immobilis]